MIPLVFVPGMLCDARLFAPQLARFEAERVCTVADLSRDDSIAAMAARLLDAAPDGPFALAGLSLGGIVAMEVARQAPERVERLALMATNHRAATAPFIAMRRRQIADARGGALRRIVVDEMKAQYLGRDRCEDDALRALVVEMALDAGVDVFERQSAALFARRDQSDTLADYRGEMLILCGEDDALCPPETHRAMAVLQPRAEFCELARIGHLVTLEAPDASCRLLARWLGEKAAKGQASRIETC